MNIFFQAGSKTDSDVIHWLTQFVEKKIKVVGDKKLQNIMYKKNASFIYASTVMFPEAFIHQQERAGKKRKEAEKMFLQAGKGEEEDERQAFKAEIKEAAKRIQEEERASIRQKMDNKDYEENEWIDHSDLDD